MQKHWWLTRRGLLVLTVTLPLLGAAAWAAEKLIVVEREAAIRKDKRTYSPKIATVKEGEEVTVVAREEPWLRVEFQGVQGWLNQSSVTSDRKVVLSGTAAATGVRVTEQSAAGRGFTPAVEKEYRRNHPGLDAAFKLLDRIEKEWGVSDDAMVKFIEVGRLGGEPAGGGR